ncbi:MAG: response regulator [Oxalicibacterium faecigallinarum]|uniref:response regulator n=1 Tax=Oxalicibacterium faecigallinarum TaxID=573741 RepID=UPI0028095F34|nr:response regulator [Oxalicibacterium faecigallinarum]MDQ7970082.1 response regulator [Oxalicibacterium faecigallinarum]
MATILNSRLAKLRAIVIDDMRSMRENIRGQLGQLGIDQVDQAATPDDALKLILSKRYDVIVCDYNLNKQTNGQQLLEYLRSQGILPPTAMFFMVTAESSYGSVASAAEFQPDAYLVKPLTGGRIADRIERLLDKQQALNPITERLRKKDKTGAVAECETVQKQHPKWIVDILRIKGSTLLELGQVEEARAVYEQALAMRHDLVWAQLGIARCDQLSGKPAAAHALIEQILSKNTQFIAAYDLLAQLTEAEGKDQQALDALKKSYDVIPSARRSRLVGDAAYRTGDLLQARNAFAQAISHTQGSLTAQASDALSLAQIHVDLHEAAKALEVLNVAVSAHQDDPHFAAGQAAIAAQAFAQLNDLRSAQAAFESAKALNGDARPDQQTLTLAKAAFAAGLLEEGVRIMSKAIKADHENVRLVTSARKVLSDTGNAALIQSVVEDAISEGALIVDQATQLMRDGQFDASLAKLEEAMNATPENTGILLAAAQLHLLWMSQKGLDRDYVVRVNGYLAKLDTLMPNNERVAKMYRFLRETLVKASREV